MNLRAQTIFFFRCPIATLEWCSLKRLSVGTLIPFLDLTSWKVMLEPAIFFFAGLPWSMWKTCNKIMWKTCNKITVERKIPSHPSEVPFYAISFCRIGWSYSSQRTKLEWRRSWRSFGTG
jgi:hypothetical protein